MASAHSALESKDPSVEGTKDLPPYHQETDEKEREHEVQCIPHMHQPRPENPRRSTDPSPAALLQSHYQNLLPLRQRNRSPYSRSHLRSRSGNNSSPSAPLMTRAHSLPSVSTAGNVSLTPNLNSSTPSSPLRSPARVRSPFRAASDEAHPYSGGSSLYDSSIDPIDEDSELELTPRPPPDRGLQPSPVHGTFPRSRRRPASPLHQMGQVTFSMLHSSHSSNTSTPNSGSSSPMMGPTKYNESYPCGLPNLHHYPSFSSSSVPSTPTSARSRSPSISSLETIEDSPDAEEAAIEADNIAKLKAAADAADGQTDGVRRSSLDVPGSRPIVGFGFGARDKRKRWSVCGAERRQDLDLETIWED
ncbi:hypothetical protein BJ546DRAFT_967200 [Cryomyces antarcticus]